MHFPRASAVPRVPVCTLAFGDVRFAARASPQGGCLFVHQLMRLYLWYCSLSYFVNCSAEKAVRYDREQVEKDGTEFSHLQVVLPAGLDEAVDFC